MRYITLGDRLALPTAFGFTDYRLRFSTAR
jgi:hypothetical protein